MRWLLAAVVCTLALPFVAADGRVDDAQGNTEGPFGLVRAGASGCNDLAADVRALDVVATPETLTLTMTVWDGAGGPNCQGVGLPRSRLDHSMLVRPGPAEVRFDLSEVTNLLGETTVTACGSFGFMGFWTDAQGQPHVERVASGCLDGVLRQGDRTSFTIPIRGTVATSNATVAYDFRGSTDAWTLGYTHSLVAGQLFAQDWVVGSSST